MAAQVETLPSSPCKLGEMGQVRLRVRERERCAVQGHILWKGGSLSLLSFIFPDGLGRGHHSGDTALSMSSSGSQPEKAILSPVGHVEMSGDIFHCHNREEVLLASSVEKPGAL